MRFCAAKLCVNKTEIYSRIFIGIYHVLTFFIPWLMCHNKTPVRIVKEKSQAIHNAAVQCHLRAASMTAAVPGLMGSYSPVNCFVPFFAKHSNHKLAQSFQSVLLYLLSSFNFGSWSCCIFQCFQRLVGGVWDVTDMFWVKRSHSKRQHASIKGGFP